MARPARPWFRFYVEALSDRKLRRLTPAQRWLWVAILGAARQSPIPGYLVLSEREAMDATDLADIAGMTVKDVERALPLFDRAGLIAHDPDLGAWMVPKWGHRQYESDVSTERTRKHRSKERSNPVPGNGSMAFEGTPPETEAENRTPLPPPGDPPAPRLPPAEVGLIEQAVQHAAERYAAHQVSTGQGKSAPGLAKWWLQENAEGAHKRAADLLARYDLGVTELAAALLEPQPRWLASYVRRPADDSPGDVDQAKVAAIKDGVRDRLRHPNRAEASA